MASLSLSNYSTLRARAQAWLSANTWIAPWQPTALRHLAASYIWAVAAIVVSAGATSILEHALSTYSFHGMVGFLAILCVSITWGLGPALLGAVCNAFVLNFVVEMPKVATTHSSVSHLVSFVLSMGFGLAIGVLGNLGEARRRQLIGAHAEAERLHVSAQHAQVEARAERDHLQKILSVLPEAVLIYDTEMRLTYMNRTAEALLGANLMGRTRREIDLAARRLDGTPLPWSEIPSVRALERGESSQGLQMLVRTAVGDIPILTSAAPLQDPDGTPTGVVSVFQDISAIRNLEQQRDRVLTTVTHDLRNPLTSISGMSQLLQLRISQVEEPGRERFAHCLKTIEASAQRMTAQIGELLDYAQTQTGRSPDLTLEPTDIVSLLQRVLGEHRHATDRHTLELRTTEEAIVAVVDPLRVERAIANLLVNAIKYSPQGGPVVVAVERAVGPEGHWLSIEISDSGLGIPSADLPHIFEQYYRASNVASTIPGSGIGLAGVRHMIQKHGGTVTLASNEGIGTTVTVRLPMLQNATRRSGDRQSNS